MIPRKFGCKCLIFCFYELEETETADLANLIESQQITPATVEEIPAEEDRDQLQRAIVNCKLKTRQRWI